MGRNISHLHMVPLDPESLLSRIKAAFSGRSYPGDDNLVYDGNYSECEEVTNVFIGKKWQDLSTDAIQGCNSRVQFKGAIGFFHF
jgi:hypothetical protein